MDIILGSFGSMAAAVAAITLLGGYVNRFLNTEGWAARLVSWAIAAVLTVAGCWFDLGFFAGLSLIDCIGTGAGLALASNGLFTIDQVKTLLGLLQARQPAVVRAVESG